jgi:hypothetical protein
MCLPRADLDPEQSQSCRLLSSSIQFLSCDQATLATDMKFMNCHISTHHMLRWTIQLLVHEHPDKAKTHHDLVRQGTDLEPVASELSLREKPAHMEVHD